MEQNEIERVLEELKNVRPDFLNAKAKRLFEAIMLIADGRDEARADLYEANNRIVDLMDIIDEKDKIINLMAEKLTTPINDKKWVIEHYTKEAENERE